MRQQFFFTHNIDLPYEYNMYKSTNLTLTIKFKKIIINLKFGQVLITK